MSQFWSSSVQPSHKQCSWGALLYRVLGLSVAIRTIRAFLSSFCSLCIPVQTGSYRKTINQGAHLPVNLNHSTTHSTLARHQSAGDLDFTWPSSTFFTFRAYRTFLSPLPSWFSRFCFPELEFSVSSNSRSVSSTRCLVEYTSPSAASQVRLWAGLGLSPADPRHSF